MALASIERPDGGGGGAQFPKSPFFVQNAEREQAWAGVSRLHVADEWLGAFSIGGLPKNGTMPEGELNHSRQTTVLPKILWQVLLRIPENFHDRPPIRGRHPRIFRCLLLARENLPHPQVSRTLQIRRQSVESR